VARLMDVKKVRSTFTDVLDDGQAAWDQSQKADPARRKTVAEDILLRFVVGWEAFASEWFVACLNHDARQFKKSTDKKIESWFRKELANSPYGGHKLQASAPTLLLSKQPPVSVVRALLDPHGRNIEFENFQAFTDRAHRELAQAYAGRAQALLNAGASEIVDAGLSIRNTIAHRSQNAVKVMNEQIAAFPSYPDLRKKRVSSAGVGTYLNAHTPAGEARLVVFRRELERTARRLVP
jgi:hypothetical protein